MEYVDNNYLQLNVKKLLLKYQFLISKPMYIKDILSNNE